MMREMHNFALVKAKISWANHDDKTGMSELFTKFFHRFKQLFKKVVVDFVRNFYAYGDIVTCV